MKKYNKLVILQKTGIEEFALNTLKSIANEVVVFTEPPKSNEEIITRCQDADCVLITFTSKIDGYVIHNLPKLKHMALCCSLYTDESSNVNLQACEENNVYVSGVSEYGDEGVIEFILSELVRFALGTNNNMFFDEPNELTSLKLGIIGLGSLGKKVAKALSLFGMNISYHGRTIQENVDYNYQTLKSLLKENDVISLHLPRNTVILNEQEFNLMSGSKILIDTTVGGAFNTLAFDLWIKDSNHYAIFDNAAVNDAFISKYKDNIRVIINPNVSGFTKNARERLSNHVISNLKTHLSK